MPVWYNTLSESSVGQQSIGTTNPESNARGEGVITGSSTLIGKNVGTVICPITKVNSPTGTISCVVQNDAATVTTVIETKDASAIPAGTNNITFTTGSPHTLVDNENIAIKASFVDNDTNYYLLDYCATAYDGTATGRAQLSTTYGHVDSQDWIASFNDDSAPPSSAGPLLPPPPAYVRL